MRTEAQLLSCVTRHVGAGVARSNPVCHFLNGNRYAGGVCCEPSALVLVAREPVQRTADRAADVLEATQADRAEETFLDATCDPPQTFSYGGVLAHVLTFSAVRRTLAIGALERYGIGDLGAGDPMAFVGGTGDDASIIRRRWS